MDVMTLDGEIIKVLPDCAICCASLSDEGIFSPLELDECPIGEDICYPDGCVNYYDGISLWG